jgi:hypothetical protein
LERWLYILAGTALVNVVVLFVEFIPLRLFFSFLLPCFLPGYILTLFLFPKTDPPHLLERVVFALGIGYAVLVLGGLAIHFLPGAITPHLVLLVYDALILVFTLCLIQRKSPIGQRSLLPKSVIWQVILIVVLASFFRLTFLGYSEFQDDEAKVVLKAVGAIQGRDDVLFLHKKGPAEILVPTMFYSLMGQINEFAARLPFALANLLGIIVVFLIGREMFNDSVGLVAALLLSINGYFVAFSRIVQYQSIVFLMTALSILCYYRFYRRQTNVRSYQVLGTLFLGVGLLAHYDAIFAVPIIAYLCLKKYRLCPSSFKSDLPSLLVSSLIVLCLLSAFYVPLIRHPHFEEVQTYLKIRTVAGGSIFHNNLNEFFAMSTVYNSTYYFVFLIVLLAMMVVIQLYKVSPGKPVGILLPLLFIAGLGTMFISPSMWQIGKLDCAIGFFVVFLIILLFSRRPSPEVKVSLLWCALPFLFYAFLFASPRTHFYVSFPAWALMGGIAWDRIRKLEIRNWILDFGFWILFFVMLYAICAYYIFFVFVQHDPEYTRTYPEHRNRYYWTFYGDELPQQQGWFGFPYRAGWKVIGYLYETDVLRGDYDSNEESFITHWYTRGELRCSYNPQYYFVAENVQDEQRIPLDEIEKDYGLTSIVLVDDEPKLRIYERGQANPLGVTTYRVEDYVSLYDSEMTSPELDAGIPTYDLASLIRHPLEVNLENKVKLLGYDLDSTRIKRGDALLLTLYWQGSEKLEEDYKVFVHLETDHIWGQEDHVPACGTRPTTTWVPGEVIVDRYSLLIDPHTPAGSYPILVGMYEPSTGRRMKIFNERGEIAGDAISLREVTVIP